MCSLLPRECSRNIQVSQKDIEKWNYGQHRVGNLPKKGEKRDFLQKWSLILGFLGLIILWKNSKENIGIVNTGN